jgi:hypothetical protein
MKRKDLAHCFSTSESSLKKWVQEGFPIKGDLRGQIKWVRENRPLVSCGITDARTRKITAEARLKELELMLKEGALLPRQPISDYIGFCMVECRDNFLRLARSLPSKLAGRDPREMPSILKAEIRLIIKTFHQKMLKGLRR